MKAMLLSGALLLAAPAAGATTLSELVYFAARQLGLPVLQQVPTVRRLPDDEMQASHTWPFHVTGLYFDDTNTILIGPGADAGYILHELVHAYEYQNGLCYSERRAFGVQQAWTDLYGGAYHYSPEAPEAQMLDCSKALRHEARHVSE